MHSDKFPTGPIPEETDESVTPADGPAATGAASDTVPLSPYGAAAVPRNTILVPSAGTAATSDEAPAPAATQEVPAPEASTAPPPPDDTDPTNNTAVVAVAASGVEDVEGSASAPSAVTPAAVSAPTSASTADTASDSSDDVAAPTARPKRRRRWVWGAAAALLLLIGVGGYAYAEHYSDVAVPGTTVAGTDVSGMSREQIVAAIESRAEAATVTITGDAQATASLTQLGTTVDAEATADAAMNRGAGIVDRFKALLDTGEIDVVTTSDDTVLEDYADGLVPDDQAKARNASVTLNTDTATFEITTSSEGLSVEATALADAAAEAARSLSPTSVDVAYENTPPAVDDDDAQAVADDANDWIAQDVTITSADGTLTYTADAATKASWITITDNLEAAPTLGVDSTKVAEWVDTQASDANVTPVTGQRNVNSRGEVVATSVEAVAGQTVNNADALTEGITAALSSGEAYAGTFEMTTSEEEWEERQIADGAENLVYQAADGEKWVDINLSNKTVTAYEGATVVRGPVYIVDGAAETPTVTGTYHVYLQYETQTMRGQNADGTDYETEGVPWISYFYQGYALHGAPWRSSWGFSGSHGCLNMPVAEAKWIYDWAEIGTTVVSHY
ncbi:L,D-transpeptidase [Actinomyces sp. MRS3W]|uniref:L,D-transpeptidase n=1 Tax=Actinomyces sp. MRS3W TaxID=2800796 RepID=UPI0028FDAECB|nr:L,D-transpeptidase family protein [Actinomyces sp. MRS3W]MDU0347240.1 L,D-transpeptidase family protein [Actinomyces sp. MRS3W]